jgi:hypothetical protein
MPQFKVGNTATGFQVTVDTSLVDLTIASVPKLAFRQLRSFFFQTLLDHKKQWLQVKGNKFGRGGGDTGQAIGVSSVQSERAAAKPNEVLYSIQPAQRRAETPREAEIMLDRLAGEIFTGNTILPVHEEGRDIRTSRLMAIPYKTRGNKLNRFKTPTPREWRQINPGKRLVFMRARRGPVHGFLLEIPRAKRSRRLRDGSIPDRATARLRFILTRFVEMDPTLQFYATWEGTSSLRDKAWETSMGKMQRALDRADPRDF